MELTDENIKRLKSLVLVGMDMNDKENWSNGEYFGNARKHWEGAMIGIDMWVDKMRESQKLSTSDEALPIGVVSNRLLAEKIILALDDYGRKTDSVEYGLPIDPDTKDFEAKKPQEMIKIVTNILNGC